MRCDSIKYNKKILYLLSPSTGIPCRPTNVLYASQRAIIAGTRAMSLEARIRQSEIGGKVGYLESHARSQSWVFCAQRDNIAIALSVYDNHGNFDLCLSVWYAQ